MPALALLVQPRRRGTLEVFLGLLAQTALAGGADCRFSGLGLVLDDLGNIHDRQVQIEELGGAFQKRDRHLPGEIVVHASAVQPAMRLKHFFMQLAIELLPLLGLQVQEERQRGLFEVVLAIRKDDASRVGLADRFQE